MTITTIKVDAELRDLLRLRAQEDGVTLGQHLRNLAAADERRRRFERLRDAMAANPPDAAYMSELEDWQSQGWQ